MVSFLRNRAQKRGINTAVTTAAALNPLFDLPPESNGHDKERYWRNYYYLKKLSLEYIYKIYPTHCGQSYKIVH